MGYRWNKTGKMIPAGVFSVLSFLTSLLYLVIIFKPKKSRTRKAL
jgi:hypothetical protein